MKKILTFLLLLIVINLAHPNNILGFTNTFSCQYSGSICSVGFTDCNAGYKPDSNLCQSFSSSSVLCSHTTSKTCIVDPNAGSGNDPIKNPPNSWLLGFDPGSGIPKALATDFLANNLVPFLVGGAIFLIIVLSLIFTVVGGIMLSMSGGNKEGMAKAKNTITYALIGLALGLGSFIFINILGTFFGINLVGQSGSTGTGAPATCNTYWQQQCAPGYPSSLNATCQSLAQTCGTTGNYINIPACNAIWQQKCQTGFPNDLKTICENLYSQCGWGP